MAGRDLVQLADILDYGLLINITVHALFQAVKQLTVLQKRLFEIFVEASL
jgi:hypothetical protein